MNNLTIRKACVIERSGYLDEVVLETDLISPFPGDNTYLVLRFSGPRKTCAQYVRDYIQIEPEVIQVS